jgi:hypothetical protein
MRTTLLLFLSLFLLLSCKKQQPEHPEKGLNLFYIILDKSSNSYSPKGGKEENYIDVDSVYVSSLIDRLYSYSNQNEDRNDLIVFFNSIDEDSRGNKELFLKLSAPDKIDTLYQPDAGSVVSSRKEHEKNINLHKQANTKIQEDFIKNKNDLLSRLVPLLQKSNQSKGSDCSGALLVADEKLKNYFMDKNQYEKVKNRIIIAYSDLVNFPRNDTSLKITHKVLRPGYTSSVPYLPEDELINITTEQEFNEYLKTLLNQ